MKKKLLEMFMRKSYKNKPKNIQYNKIIKRKGNNLYLKWKDYDNSFGSRIDKEDIFIYQ